MHQHLIHVNIDKVIKAYRDAGIKINEKKAREYHCRWCHLAKSTKVVSRDQIPRAQRPLARVFFNSIPHKPIGRRDYNHTIHLLDNYSQYHWVIFIKSKSDSLKQFEEWIDYIENQTGLTIQVIHGNGGTEFSPTALRELCNRKGKALYLNYSRLPQAEWPF